MSEDNRVGQAALEAAVRITESICSLPGVATQNWCDQAAGALLPLGRSASALVMIGHVDEQGRLVQRPEATGVAGVYTAEVTTTVGRTSAAATSVPVDASDGSLSSLRAGVDQARELGWAPLRPAAWTVRAGTPESFGLQSAWRNSPLGRRWESINPPTLLLAAVGLPGPIPERTLVVEVGINSGTMLPVEAAAVLSVTLPLLARRLIAAIGEHTTSSSDWLTQKEQVVLSHLLMGKSVREIAQELERSQHTVHDHVKSLHRKLRANSRGELVARALGHLAPERKPEIVTTTSERSERIPTGE
jgi:DNA-binding CsgD family transcriptional regulator